MATSKYETHVGDRYTWSLNWTADGTITLKLPNKPVRSICWSSDGADGTGTLTWNVSVDNAQFNTIGVNTSTDPANPTTITSATAAGNWVMHEHDTGWPYLQFVLSGSTNPNLNVTVSLVVS